MGDREATVQRLKAQQDKWFRERQAEMDRKSVMSQLNAESMGGLPAQHQQRSMPAASASAAGSHAAMQQQQYMTQSYMQQHQRQGHEGTGRLEMDPVRQSMQQQQQQQQQLGWSGSIRPEAVIDKLTERIADRLRSELKLELQKESETLQQRVAHENVEMDDFLAKELETQNTCPICYELMVPPTHAPQLLFPCGHTFCAACASAHLDKHKKTHCPVCRKKVESRAPNYSLQQLILNFVNKKHRMQSPVVAAVAQSMEASRTGALGAAAFNDDSISELDRLRRQSSRIQVRLTVLENELTDTIAEHQALEGRCASARLVLDHMQAEEQNVVQRMAALQAELELVRSQLCTQQSTLDQAAEVAAAVLSRRQMLVDTIEPLHAELKKIEILKQGLAEQDRL